jgi:hypothetical protein
MARYTPNVGKWHRRAVTLLVTAMIAGGQTVIILCNAWCMAHSDTATAAITPSDVAQNAHQHHASDNQAGVSRPDRDVSASADHAHEQAAVSTTVIPPDPHTLLNVSSADCCTTLESGPATLAAARADNLVMLASYVTAFIHPIALDSSHPQLGSPTHAAPPGELSSAQTPLPLRI